MSAHGILPLALSIVLILILLALLVPIARAGDGCVNIIGDPCYWGPRVYAPLVLGK